MDNSTLFVLKHLLKSIKDKPPIEKRNFWGTFLYMAFVIWLDLAILAFISSLGFSKLRLGIQIVLTIVLALFFAANFFRSVITGYIQGVRETLEKPHPQGKTWIQILYEDEEIWEGEEFPIPSSGPVMGNNSPISISLKDIEVPKRYADWCKWRDAFFIVILPGIEAGKNPRTIMRELKRKGYPHTYKSYLKIRKAGENHKLEIPPPDV